MAVRITRDVLESYVFCPYKAYLKLTGLQGIKSDYENLLSTTRCAVRSTAIDTICARYQDNQIDSRIELTASALERGPQFVLDATIEDSYFSLTLDGLKRIADVSRPGQSLYIPMLFHEGVHIRKEQRLLLEMQALLVSEHQVVAPGSGIIWHGKECKATAVRLDPKLRQAKRTIADLKDMCGASAPPKLVLNAHCQICEFRQRCRDQAVQEDNISLLRGMTAKELKGYDRKGIFTITQLAHTFRPRRKAKRVRQRSNHRYHALQALAIRDRRIYVLGIPELPDSPVRMYLDVEGDPDAGFVYLIGLIIVENGSEQRYSFWADTKDEEAGLFEEFVAEVTRHEDL